jgi:hypothetical protein
MNYLTIEKFGPQSKAFLIRRLAVGLILLVVPFIGLATWALYDFDSARLTSDAQVAQEDEEKEKEKVITVLR